MPVADSVGEHEVPAGTHENGHVPPDLAVAAVEPLAGRTPGLLEGPAGMVHRTHLHLKLVDAGLDELRDVHGVARERPARRRDNLSVQLDLAVVVDSLGAKPDGLPRPVFGNRHLRAVCRRVEVARAKSDIRDLPLLDLVVKSPVRILHDTVFDERREHGSRHDGRHPLPWCGLLRHFPRSRSRQLLAPRATSGSSHRTQCKRGGTRRPKPSTGHESLLFVFLSINLFVLSKNASTA